MLEKSVAHAPSLDRRTANDIADCLLTTVDHAATLAEIKWARRSGNTVDPAPDATDSDPFVLVEKNGRELRALLGRLRSNALTAYAPQSRLGAWEAMQRINAVHDAAIQLLEWEGPHPAYPGTAGRQYREWQKARADLVDMMAVDTLDASSWSVDEAAGTSNGPVAKRRRRGARAQYDANDDRRIAEQWKASGEKSYETFARRNGMTKETVQAAVDRDRKRRRSPPE
jgi:hypothetical protein